MFVDFDDILNSEPETQYKVPKKFLEYLNSELPNGIHYVPSGNGSYIINSDDGEMCISGIKFKPNRKQKEVLKNNFTIENVLSLAYNSQKKIEIVPVEEGYITINNQKVEINKLEFDLLDKILVEKGKFYLIPPKMNKVIDLTIANDKYQRKLKIKRIPNYSVNELKFSSEHKKSLMIDYILNIKTRNIKLNMSFDLKYAKSITEIIETVCIYNSFVDGKGYIENVNICLGKVDNNYKYDEENILLWKKILKIESILNIKFNPNNSDISLENILDIEEIYQSLINNCPFRSKNIINSITGEWNFKNIDELKKNNNDSLFFQFNGTYTTQLFKKNISLPALIMIFNSKLVNLQKNESKTVISLDDMSNTRKRYTSIMCFKNNSILNKYKEDIFVNDTKIKSFQEAKTAREYLKDN